MDPNTVPSNPTLPPGLKSNNLRIILGAVSLIVVFSLGGFFWGSSAKKEIPVSQAVPTVEMTKADPFFGNQTVTVRGEIIKVSGSNITLKNTRGQIRDFSVLPKVMIYKFKPATAEASTSPDLKTIEIDKQVSIVLLPKDNQYQVQSITYIPSPPPLPSKP